MRGLIAGTCIVSDSRECQTAQERHGGTRMDIRYAGEGSVPEVAIERARAGWGVAVVNAASAYRVGGGFLSGGRHALEEALCAQSTLYPSLEAAARQACAKHILDSRYAHPNIPEDGVVFSPGVEMLREQAGDGYRDLPNPVKLVAVVSVAMPNRNCEDPISPVDRLDGDEYRALLGRKFRALLSAVAQSKADVLVMPDVGCGVFRNKPGEVGELFGAALLAHGREGMQVECAGSREFFEAAAASASSHTPARRRCDTRSRSLAAGHGRGHLPPPRAGGSCPWAASPSLSERRALMHPGPRI